jgi:2'-5' RNA ligase
MLRYYIAIEPPVDQRLRIGAVMRQMGNPWPVPHITVIAPDGLTPDLAWLSKVIEVAAQSARFSVKIGEAKTFDDRVLYLSVEGTDLPSLHQRILEAVSPEADLVPEWSSEHEYVPHLTLTRSHNANVLSQFEELASTLGDIPSFEVIELTVFRREDPSTQYRAWRRLPLANSRQH